MGKSKNTNPNIYRSKWDLPFKTGRDYSRRDKKQIIEEEYELLEEEKKLEEEEENNNDKH